MVQRYQFSKGLVWSSDPILLSVLTLSEMWPQLSSVLGGGIGTEHITHPCGPNQGWEQLGLQCAAVTAAMLHAWHELQHCNMQHAREKRRTP